MRCLGKQIPNHWEFHRTNNKNRCKDYLFPSGIPGKLHCVFDTDSGGVKRGLVFRAKRARSSPPVKSGMDPAIFMRRDIDLCHKHAYNGF